MAVFVATLLKVENVTRPKASYDEKGEAHVEDVTFGSNPEYACIEIEAKSLADARKQAEKILAGDLHGLGWTSYADAALWGKEQRRLVDVVEQSEHVKRSGQGNQRGEEEQDARFERFRRGT